jgi:hypothetical protein
VPRTRRPTSSRTSCTRASAQPNGKQPPSPTRGPDLDLEIMTITPELAQEWLDRGGTNHKITRRIDAMTVAILRREWRLTGEAIKLDHEGLSATGRIDCTRSYGPVPRSARWWRTASAKTPST